MHLAYHPVLCLACIDSKTSVARNTLSGSVLKQCVVVAPLGMERSFQRHCCLVSKSIACKAPSASRPSYSYSNITAEIQERDLRRLVSTSVFHDYAEHLHNA